MLNFYRHHRVDMDRELTNLTLNEIQDIELGIMDYIHKICEENCIKYYLTGGSLIGAIRHQGFIPWDDDIDIAMPRKDYEQFKNIARVIPHEFYYFLSEEEPGNYFSFGKMVDLRTALVENDKDMHYKYWCYG